MFALSALCTGGCLRFTGFDVGKMNTDTRWERKLCCGFSRYRFPAVSVAAARLVFDSIRGDVCCRVCDCVSSVCLR